MSCPNPDCPNARSDEAKARLLSHYSDLFTYHAGQRLNSIRFALIVFAAIASVISLAARSTNPAVPIEVVVFWSAVAGLVFVIFFRLLDIRNESLVHVTENALKELVRDQVGQIVSSQSLNKDVLTVMENYEGKQQKFIVWMSQYKFILRFLSYLLVVIFLAMIWVNRCFVVGWAALSCSE